jgi:hypothetical protein
LKAFAVEGVENAELRAAKLHCLFQHGVEHDVEPAVRVADGVQDVRRRGLVFQRFGELAGAGLQRLLKLGNGPPETGHVFGMRGHRSISPCP